VSVLSEAYSHDPFERRVQATTAFVREVVSVIAEQQREVLRRTRRGWNGGTGLARPSVAVRAELTRSPQRLPVLVEPLEATGDSLRTEPGLRPGYRRTHTATPVVMPVYDRFDTTLLRQVPVGWILDAAYAGAIDRLRLHGVRVEQIDRRWTTTVESFRIDSVAIAPRIFQGHREVRVEGKWMPRRETVAPGSWFVPAAQDLGVLAAVLLEPESDDGLTTWNAFTDGLAVGRTHPVRRVLADPPRRRDTPTAR
jgi:hypothetical protein